MSAPPPHLSPSSSSQHRRVSQPELPLCTPSPGIGAFTCTTTTTTTTCTTTTTPTTSTANATKGAETLMASLRLQRLQAAHADAYGGVLQPTTTTAEILMASLQDRQKEDGQKKKQQQQHQQKSEVRILSSLGMYSHFEISFYICPLNSLHRKTSSTRTRSLNPHKFFCASCVFVCVCLCVCLCVYTRTVQLILYRGRYAATRL